MTKQLYTEDQIKVAKQKIKTLVNSPEEAAKQTEKEMLAGRKALKAQKLVHAARGLRDGGGAFGDTVKLLNNHLKRVESIPQPKKGNMWQNKRHELTVGAADEVRIIADFDV